ncbi:MAG: chromosome segregation ATPase [Bacteriovoracaceae bacterium]|jgi:chromosome segregation ATPase
MGKKNNVRRKIDMVESQLKKSEAMGSQIVVSTDSRPMSKDKESKIKIHKIKSNMNKAYLNFLVNRKSRKMQLENKKISKLTNEISQIETVIDHKFEEMDNLEAQIRLQNFKIEEKVKEKDQHSNKLKEKTNELQARKKVYLENTKLINKEEGENKTLIQKISALNVELESQLKTKNWQTEYFEKIKNDKNKKIEKCEEIEMKSNSLEEENQVLKQNIDILVKENEEQALTQNELESKKNEKEIQLGEGYRLLEVEKAKKINIESDISKSIFEIEEATKKKNEVIQQTQNLEHDVLSLNRKLNDLIVQKNELELDLEVDSTYLKDKVLDRDTLLADVNNEKKEVEELIVSMNQVKQDSENYTLELSSLNDQFENLLIKKEELIVQIQNDKDNNTHICSNIKLVQNDIVDLESDLTLLDREIELNRIEKEQKEEELRTVECNYEKLVHSYSSSEEELKSIVHAQGLLNKSLEEIDLKIVTQKEKNHLISNEVQRITLEKEQVRKKLENSQNQLIVLQQEEVKSSEVQERLQELILKSGVDIEGAKVQATSLEKALESLKTSNQEVEELLNQSILKLETQNLFNSDLKNKIHDVEVKRDACHAEFLQKEALVEKHLNESTELSQNLELLKKEMTELLSEEKNIHKKINYYVNEKKDTNSAIKDQKSEIKELSKKLEQQNQDLRFEKSGFENKNLEYKSLKEKYEMILNESISRKDEASQIENSIVETNKKISELNKQIQVERRASEESLKLVRQKHTDFSRIRGQVNSLERLVNQNDLTIKRNEIKIQEYNKMIEELKNKMFSLDEGVDKKEVIKNQESILNDKQSELSLLQRRSMNSRKKINVSDQIEANDITEQSSFEILAKELSVKYSHSVTLDPNISKKAKHELERLYKRIVRSFNNLAILNINRFSVELTHDENGLLCNVILFKGNKRSDYEKDVGGFLRINPFYGLRKWEEHEQTVSFSLEIEKTFLQSSQKLKTDHSPSI